MSKCPCDSGKTFEECCQPFITGSAIPKTPEALMRSRYTAYTQANIDYISQTMKGKPSFNFNPEQARAWAIEARWVGLITLYAKDNKVEFIARYCIQEKEHWLHELSEFKLENDRWYYIDGTHPKINRNVPCPCGSGKKFKRCHANSLE